MGNNYTAKYFEAWDEENLINVVIAFGLKLGEPVEIGEFNREKFAEIAARMVNEKMRRDAIPITIVTESGGRDVDTSEL